MVSKSVEHRSFFERETLVQEVEQLRLQGLLADEDLDVIDDNMEEVTQDWKFEEGSNAIPGISINYAFFGKHIVGEEQKRINNQNRLRPYYPPEELEAIPAVKDTESFHELFQVTEGLTNPQYMLLDRLIAKELADKSLKQADITASDVDLFLITTSIPVEPDWAAKIAATIGISLEKMWIYHYACNSTGKMIYDVHNHEFDTELAARLPGFVEGTVRANIMCYAYETATRIAARGDKQSGGFFASAAAATVLEYSPVEENSPFTLLDGESIDVEQGAQYLQYSKPYDNWPDYRTKYRVRESLYLTDPGEGWVVNMNGPKSGGYFRRHARDLAKRVMGKFAERLSNLKDKKFDFRDENGDLNIAAYAQLIKRIIVHQPGVAVFNSLSSELVGEEKAGFTPEQLQLVIREGNAPSVTIPIALARQLDDITDGDLLNILSFGAGGGFTDGIYQYRELPKQEHRLA